MCLHPYSELIQFHLSRVCAYATGVRAVLPHRRALKSRGQNFENETSFGEAVAVRICGT
jgi:hypothetical protein